MRTRRRIALAALSAVSGCTLVTSLDGLTGGAGPDAGGPAEAAPPADVFEVGASEVAPPADVADAAHAPRRWRKLAVTGPSARHSTRMVYDPGHRTIVLFGGNAGGGDLSDTWTWDGATWQNKTPPISPAPRRASRMAYDGARAAVFLFDGLGGPSPPDQWTWDGTTWIQHASTNHPKALHGSKIAFDAKRGVAVVFAGFDDSNTARNDTWEWDGKDWTQRTPAVSPSARWGHALTYDAARERVVLFGGFRAGGKLDLQDTWEYDGVTWTERNPSILVPPRAGACMEYDAARRVSVLFGGYAGGGVSRADTWEWDGNDWAPGPTGPEARRTCALAYDAARDQLVLFGGTLQSEDAMARPVSPDTWVYE